MFIGNKKCRIYAACGVSQTPICFQMMWGASKMLVLGINKILKWCQITNGDRTYTCPTKYINGELFFRFKNEWHKGAEFVSNHAEELVEEGGKIFSQSFKH